MKELDLAPYHLFKFRDINYVFDINSNAVMRLDDPAYDALSLRLKKASPESIASKLSSKYGQETAQNTLKELDLLEEEGLFKGPIYAYDDDENEAYIQRLVRMSTSNIELYLAEACNLRCKYCYVNENDALRNGLMPRDIAKQAVDLCFERAGNSDQLCITFFGGEPLLNKPVMRYVIGYSQQLAKKRNKTVQYSLTTNGTLLDDEIIGYIKRYNFGLMISLDGPKDIQDNMRPFANGKGSFDTATRNIKRLMERRRSVTVRCTVSNQCLDMIRIVNFLEDFGFTRVAMSRCNGRAYDTGPYDIGPAENAILNGQDDYFMERLFEQLDKGERIKFNPWARVVEMIHEKQNRRMRCGVGRGCTTVGIDGNLYPCHRYVGMENYVLGHVSTGIDKEKFADYLRSYFATKKKCETCWAINLCGGYCPWHVSHDDGACRPPLDWWCSEFRNWYERGVWMYEVLQSQYPEYLATLVGEEGKPLPRSQPILR